MKSSTAVILFGVFLAFLVMPENILARLPLAGTTGPLRPHEEHRSCGSICENTCQNALAERGPCPLVCISANYCVRGYIRLKKGGACILPEECPGGRPQIAELN